MKEVNLCVDGVRILASSQGVKIESVKDSTKYFHLDYDWITLLVVNEEIVDRFLRAVDDGLATTLYLGYEPSEKELKEGILPETPMLTLHVCKDKTWRFGFVDRPSRKMSRKRQWLRVDGMRFFSILFAAIGYRYENTVVDTETAKLSQMFWIVTGHHSDPAMEYVINPRAMLFEYSPGDKIAIQRDKGDFWENIADLCEVITDSDISSSVMDYQPDEELSTSTVNVVKISDSVLSIELLDGDFLWDSIEFPIESLQMFNVIKPRFWPQSSGSTVTFSFIDEDDDDSI